ncbi:CLUMA_CG011457, isoform A [Clunio marinus]|uniref:CLUMA_CG011457, isoform A n=1 Tax=Clunio marinus TaxID=568069 RepID=A0A1J1II11_9DIPT|nr:CLUMA_CG011457, isoform A [Clunio marinus]
MEQYEQENVANPKEKANVFSVLTFWYTIKMFKKGYNKVLEVNDLFVPMKADESSGLGDRLEKNWMQQQNGKTKPSLLKAIVKTFWREYAFLGFMQFFNDIVLRLSQPLFLGWLLKYFSPDSQTTRDEAFIYAGILVALSAISAITINQFLLSSFTNGMKVRLATCSLIYRKSLKLSTTALGNTSVGKVVNLLSNDVSRFDIVSVFLHSMWMAPLLTIIVGILLYREAGIPGLIGMVVIAIVTPIQSYTGKLSSIFRYQTALRTDERVRLMDEIVNGIQVIKLYAWEKPFKKLIHYARDKELKVIKKSSYVRALYMTFMLFTTRSALFCTMMATVLLKDDLTASRVFVMSSYFAIISTVMSQMFVRGIAEIAEALVAMRRLQNFLEYDEKEETNLPKEKEKLMNEFHMNGEGIEKELLINSQSTLAPDVALSLRNVSCRWKTVEETLKLPEKDKKREKLKNLKEIPKVSEDENKFDEANEDKLTLNNVSLEVRKGILVGILGHVGSGKSSLLQTILGELPTEAGSLAIKGNLSFATQEPWVFSGSVRQNILFGQEMDKERYEDVVNACALKKDFEMFPFGDQTLIGERGSSLSGGQKARVSLARALYRKADIYLLDDPLSAVDAHVGKHLFDQCLAAQGFLGKENATRILVTHQVHFLKNANWVVIMSDGKIERQGRAEDLANAGIDFMKIAEETEVEETRRRSLSRASSRSSESVSSSTAVMEEKPAEKEFDKQRNVEEMSKGKVKGNVMINYLKAGGNFCKIGFSMFLFGLTQTIASMSDFWVGYWTNQEEMRNVMLTTTRKNNETFDYDDDSSLSMPGNETMNLNNTKTEPITTEILPQETLVYVGGFLIGALFVFAIARSIFFYTITVGASRNLHKMAFNGIISTKMRFFDLNPSGRILNRFSKDLGSIDEWLPKCLLDAAQVILMAIGAIVVTAFINPLFMIPLGLLFIVFIYIRRYYLKTSKNIKRLEGITKSPAFVHLAATINGLATVRAFGAQEILIREFDQHQNLHTGAWFMYITASQAFGFALDVLCMIFVVCVTFSFLLFDTREFNGASVGLAISQSMGLTAMLQWGIRQSAEVMNQMMGVERVLEYRDLENEQREVTKAVDKSWPQKGKIKFNNVTYRYSKEMEPVLKGVTFEVNECEKIGIVGRTGAGKSSLIGSLFRMAEIEGEIIIDNIDTSKIDVEQLRSKISIIPQDPVLFSGTMRKNLDPFDEYSDDHLWEALEEVKLKDIPALQVQGLQTLVAAGGINFSVGQRQLTCLARSLLRNNRILVLDEATANVDPETDALIQETIREKFKDCTVMTIAHRLHTVMDSDKILVMNFGNVEEFDTPINLLEIRGGIFSEMVKATGLSESKNLTLLAKKNI